jgi:hypothetical protein
MRGSASSAATILRAWLCTSPHESARWPRRAKGLASRTVRDLVGGSGLRFADRGEHELKGIPDAWRLFALEP